MNQRPFKLLHLPTVALRNVLQFLNPIELFELSQCSQKATSIIPLAGTKKYSCRIDVSYGYILINDYMFCVEHNGLKTGYKLRGERKFKGIIADIEYESEHEIISFWDVINIGLKHVLFYISNIFGCPINSFESSWTMPAEIYNSIIDYIITRQSEIGKLAIDADSLTDADVMKIFRSLRITEELELSVMKKCTVIILSRSTLTDNDMKWFLESWKLGKDPNLEYLSIHSNSFSSNFTVFDLPSLQDTVNPHLFSKDILGETRKVYGAIDIQRDDGVAAKIHFDVKDSIVDLLVL
ncbi:hypothetical protein CRE_22967 [Caenorhabditis remanei]|uniref:F-box domain-containing protein n=1 Tax=Caenorhabditis remanei TaxID=31234 RepID=E3MW35_CAERE|nr:hypothetical protein CRE_22967 [Caenorhabditis remanei]